MFDFCELYLGFLEYYDGKYCAASAKSGAVNANAQRSNRFTPLVNAMRIKSLQIDASVYSPPILRAVCFGSSYFAKKIIPNYSVFGVISVTPSLSAIVNPYANNNDEYHCLFSNTQDEFTPFVAVDVEINDFKTVTVVLMEKRAFSLALTHSFACIGYGSRGDGTKDTSDDGLLSVAELVEKLSIIPEDDVPQDEDKRIFNFDAYCMLESDKEEVSSLAKQKKNNYRTLNCALLSRFICPSSQSRLEIISSLMCKYGYGFAFKPEDRQYYAVDLLSNYAPGFYTGLTAHYYAGQYKDRYYFKTKNPESYFLEYGRMFLEWSGYNNLIGRFDDEESGADYILSHDFTDFYVIHLLRQSVKDSEPIFFQSSTGWDNYCYVARNSPLSSATNLLLHKIKRTKDFDAEEIQIKTTPGYDLSISGKVTQYGREDWQDVSESLSMIRDGDLASIILQDDLNVHTEGSQVSLFEDQVELNSSEVKENKIIVEDVKIESVNQRLAYAKYKLNYLRQNYLTQTFEFEHNKGLIYSFNLVYSLFGWLGVHTDVFSRIANSFKMDVYKHENPDYNKDDEGSKEFAPTSSGSSHGIYDKFINPNPTFDKYSVFFNKHFKHYYEFSRNAYLYKGKEALFGKLSIFINIGEETINHTMVSTSYSTSATLTFYSDFTDCNIGTHVDSEEIRVDSDYSYSIHDDREVWADMAANMAANVAGNVSIATSRKESAASERDKNGDDEGSGGEDGESIWPESALGPVHPIYSSKNSSLRNLRNNLEEENEKDGLDRMREIGSIRPDIISLREGLGFGRTGSALRTYSLPDMENRSNEGNRLMKRPSHREETNLNPLFDEDV